MASPRLDGESEKRKRMLKRRENINLIHADLFCKFRTNKAKMNGVLQQMLDKCFLMAF